ncbi:hypothetical protein J6590_036707 [Homalodisca vitripennis]|nr:hypothetical protein J6590_036707 [Homalodisca vitripennis]
MYVQLRSAAQQAPLYWQVASSRSPDFRHLRECVDPRKSTTIFTQRNWRPPDNTIQVAPLFSPAAESFILELTQRAFVLANRSRSRSHRCYNPRLNTHRPRYASPRRQRPRPHHENRGLGMPPCGHMDDSQRYIVITLHCTELSLPTSTPAVLL